MLTAGEGVFSLTVGTGIIVGVIVLVMAGKIKVISGNGSNVVVAVGVGVLVGVAVCDGVGVGPAGVEDNPVRVGVGVTEYWSAA